MEVQQLARVYIYTLSHPITNEVRYIGKANNHLKRLKSHIRDSSRRNTPVYCWIRKLIKKGLVPKISVIFVTNSGNWQKEEIRLIKEYSDNGYRLLNIASGGDEPFCPKDVRVKNGIKLKQRVNVFKKLIILNLDVVKKIKGINAVHAWIFKVDKKTINKNKNQEIVLDFIKKKYNYET